LIFLRGRSIHEPALPARAARRTSGSIIVNGGTKWVTRLAQAILRTIDWSQLSATFLAAPRPAGAILARSASAICQRCAS